MTYLDLRNFAKKLVKKADEWKIPCQIYKYSLEIGNFEETKTIDSFDMRTKYIVLFAGSAFDEMQIVIDAFSPLGKLTLDKGKDSLQKGEIYGRDVLQSVQELRLYKEIGQSSGQYTKDQILEEGKRWLKAQELTYSKANPKITDNELVALMKEIKKNFKDVISYLEHSSKPWPTVRITRLSGVSHKMQAIPNTGTKRVSYRNLVIVFSSDNKFPKLTLPKPSTNRKARSNSIAEQYRTDPSSFQFYRKFGIFEIYDK
ncbi:hypothetical protein AB895_0918 [Acinetobacter baumannii]|nr:MULTISPECIES: hypothetical protein [Acinetobacter calcoaceticus/baumannii complex]EHU2485246.1 hypothetical protein [Acinetobacter baumannii]KMV05131.1 hypothetical protein AB895_0918 [Acinetobacter baumannii]MBR7724040.1 hypothetical protein [Acinetobacter nosocomialis]MDO7445085.1 hypothetical protein [Acinetobacter baumannii]UAB16703.1 hypothetical protein H2786_02780 [Acinetobacter baumannii]